MILDGAVRKVVGVDFNVGAVTMTHQRPPEEDEAIGDTPAHSPLLRLFALGFVAKFLILAVTCRQCFKRLSMYFKTSANADPQHNNDLEMSLPYKRMSTIEEDLDETEFSDEEDEEEKDQSGI